jgi:2-polyprenyl-6-hydroxyphenyl methylase/3-demethylubiquinone-9 3-methyltransferase
MARRHESEDPRDVSSHFRFGRNWRDYAKHIDSGKIAQAEKGMARLFGSVGLAEKRLLDIGSGSGLHSVAALRLGCAHVVATDIDADSVETTQATLRAYAPGRKWECHQKSVLAMTPEDFGRFDVVYSWGVLHHTGAMWDAIRRAGALVADGGHLAIAIYQKTRFCGFWEREKRFYSQSPGIVQFPIRLLYVAAAALRKVLAGRNPLPGFAGDPDGGPGRGMRAWNDVHDWLGGYPYESASPEEVQAFLSNLGFSHIRSLDVTSSIGLFGSGCAQYLFKNSPRQP